MNRLAAVLVLLGVFWTQSSALETFALQEPGNAPVTITIDKEHHVIEIHVRSGLYSSDTIIDYARGYIAIRLFSRNACFIMKRNKEYIPDLQEIQRLALEKQNMNNMNTVRSQKNLWLQYQSGKSAHGSDKDWIVYGKPIEQLCTALPLYQLADTQPLTNANECANAGIPSILGIKICEKAN
ncbi:PREDICTED: gastrokine-2 isoform X1 [Calidris pugnax]|uniref:gastrokine-2 isoform X1 n=1 Tax=Calidris pugnax TaxID=198806 RepID=UPI00071CDF85|nr:PREDICTED: gastrokine-2 isoform X1 [Calidris pugnax]